MTKTSENSLCMNLCCLSWYLHKNTQSINEQGCNEPICRHFSFFSHSHTMVFSWRAQQLSQNLRLRSRVIIRQYTPLWYSTGQANMAILCKGRKTQGTQCRKELKWIIIISVAWTQNKIFKKKGRRKIESKIWEGIKLSNNTGVWLAAKCSWR